MHTGSLIQFGDVDPLNRAAHAVRRWSVNHGGRTFQCAVALRKNEKPLRTALNEWVHANRRNGKRNAIHKKHHGAGLPTKTLS